MEAKSLRVCMLTQSYYPRGSGAERQLWALLPALRAAGVESMVVSRRGPGQPAREIVDGTPVFRLSAPEGRLRGSVCFSVTAVLLLLRQRARFDLLHAHDPYSPATAALLASLALRRPVVVKLTRGGRLGEMAVLRRSATGAMRIRLLGRTVDRFVAISAEIAEELRSASVPSSRISLIPNGVDTTRFRPLGPAARRALREQLGIEERKVALFVGRLALEKGLATLIEVWQSIGPTLPNRLLLVVGDGPEREALERRADESVRFIGSVDDPLPYYQAADCFVMPSDTEGLPNALLEAMACGLPCVATTIGGNTDLLRDDREGRLVPVGDRDSLAEALRQALGGSQRERLGEAARKRAEQAYSLDSVARRLATLYRELVGSRHPS